MYAFTYKVVYDTNKTINVQLRGDTAEDAEEKIDALFPEGTTVNSKTLLMCQELADETPSDNTEGEQTPATEPATEPANNDNPGADNPDADNPGSEIENG